MITGTEETLMSKLTSRIREQLLLKGIQDFKITDGSFHFANANDKSKANDIIRDYLTFLLDNDKEYLI
ncbi:conserved hypothetical protein [uncultured Sporomusa sp.]|uniref:Uncharacterized protein n=1 Tax=uncultured Sporomusa sp. TaxID=307249 RepID=A0A212LS79_9FIRM|nr:hypothetical protein [uncultured Sporomusa sp.]SCM80300.1 conserved hypothetical protein [uncultured Sporomusa sp.]